MQIAFWDESGLGMPEEAANAARAALNLAPSHGGALALLEDLYRRQRNWDRYVEILIRKAPARGSTIPYKLLEAYREVLRYEPQHLGALAGLASVCEETADWEPAADALRKLIAALPPSLEAERLLARHRLGAILKDRLGDVRGAEEQLVEVLAAPGGEGHVPTMLTLAAIYRERRDWLKARQLLGRAAAAVQDLDERVRLLVEAAEICATQLDDENQAAEIYARRAVAGSGAHRSGRQAGGESLSPRRVDQPAAAGGAAGRPDGARARGRREAGRGEGPALVSAGAGRRGDRRSRARGGGVQRGARPRCPRGRSTLAPRRDLAALTFRLEQWPEAAAAHEALLAGHAGELKRPEMLAALERLGIAYMRAGEPAKAIRRSRRR